MTAAVETIMQVRRPIVPIYFFVFLRSKQAAHSDLQMSF